ncbi:hypothetical protein C4D60_Mb04t02070 [Musa balbisiana]|uniref:Uncharacterized protein n=1 Tax=Musa balbisiana TaxID=52838 RepID=A0A4S8K945_MUSBA|nr:hypothetical protein C4D60_Mb04t02070 [Musa balbisiana]
MRQSRSDPRPGTGSGPNHRGRGRPGGERSEAAPKHYVLYARVRVTGSLGVAREGPIVISETKMREKRGLVPGDDLQPEPKRQKAPALASVIVEALKVDSLQRLCSSLEPILRRVVSSYDSFQVA